ncbi:MAG: response regulator transcription factor [Crocosphaera sp.]|nr:response regulator transcription factor [Crocosphaera sp.]
MKILIVEDEMEIAKIIQTTLERESFDCFVAYDGLTALDLFQQQEPDLIILDIMLPKLDGLEVCTRIRQKVTSKDPYILMLTAKGEEIDRVIGLSTGADDYLVKPFSPIELVARVRALLRRSLRHGGTQANVYETHHFIVDLDKHSAIKKLKDNTEETLELTTLEFNLLSTFMSYPGRVWSRTQLIDKLWGNDFFGDERVVDTHVRRLRKKIEPDTANPTFIKTVVGVGYKFEDETSS